MLVNAQFIHYLLIQHQCIWFYLIGDYIVARHPNKFVFCICNNYMVDAGVYTSFPAGSEQDIWHIYQLMHCLNGVQTPPITSAANVQTQSLCSFHCIR